MAGDTGSNKQGMTCLGKLIVTFFVLACIGGAAFLYLQDRPSVPAPGGTPAPASNGGTANTPQATIDLSGDVIAAATAVPDLASLQPYEVKGNTILVELSEYAGYAGLIAANGGMEPSEESYFFQKHGFKVKLTLSEEESWSALNSGKMAASATTVDVLAVYNKKMQVVVPAQIGFSRGADGIVVRSDIRSINQLKGKTLLTSQFTEAEFFIRYLAQEAGLQVKALGGIDETPDPARINLVFCEDAFQGGDTFLKALQAGDTRLAGCVTWAPKTTEVVDASDGKAKLLVTNRNLLVIADILIVNKAFAEAHPKMVRGLTEGLLEGNRRVRYEQAAYLPVVAKGFGWSESDTREELSKVHLANLPENKAFFSGAIDAAGSFGAIYEWASYVYGSDMIRSTVPAERFLATQYLDEIEKAGLFAGQSIAIAPIQTRKGPVAEQDPLLSRDIHFYFEANSHKLDMNNQQNLRDLEAIKKMIQISPGSLVLLRGHVDQSKEYMDKVRQQGGEELVRTIVLKGVELSKNRAAEIRRILVEQHGIKTERIETIGVGAREPVAESGEANRRVEVQWFTVE